MEENHMESEKDVRNDECCGRCWLCMHHRGCCHGHGRGWWRIIKIIFLLVIFALIFGAGMLMGAVKVIRNGGWGSTAGELGQARFGGWGMMANDQIPSGMWNMMGVGDESRGLTRMMGTVTGVTENKISISDNGAQAHTIVSGSNTLIVVSGQPMGLSALKPGQTVIAVGTLDATGQLQAQTIQVTP